jgi:hypothetical protein
VGRGGELAEIEALLGNGDARLLTLTGPRGIGKTRLAVEAADRLRGRYEDGVPFVALDGLQSPDVVAATIAGALGIRDAEADPFESFRAYLVGRELLVLLDSFEHVVAAAPLVAALLESGADRARGRRGRARRRAARSGRQPPGAAAHAALAAGARAPGSVFLDELRAALGADRFETAYERGRAQDVSEAQEAAMRLLSPD